MKEYIAIGSFSKKNRGKCVVFRPFREFHDAGVEFPLTAFLDETLLTRLDAFSFPSVLLVSYSLVSGILGLFSGQ